jgi:hypothetical protein
MVTVPVNSEEKKLILKLAALNHTTMSELVRQTVLRMARRAKVA